MFFINLKEKKATIYVHIKELPNNHYEGLYRIPVKVLCVSNLNAFLLDCCYNELFEARERACVWGISCSAVGRCITICWDFINVSRIVLANRSRRLLLFFFPFSPPEAVLTEVSCRTWNTATRVMAWDKWRLNREWSVFPARGLLYLSVQTRACDLLRCWREGKGSFFFFFFLV